MSGLVQCRIYDRPKSVVGGQLQKLPHCTVGGCLGLDIAARFHKWLGLSRRPLLTRQPVGGAPLDT